MFDLNNLKLVNGNLGHEMGDKYIEAFSALLASLQNDRISAYRVGFQLLWKRPMQWKYIKC